MCLLLQRRRASTALHRQRLTEVGGWVEPLPLPHSLGARISVADRRRQRACPALPLGLDSNFTCLFILAVGRPHHLVSARSWSISPNAFKAATEHMCEQHCRRAVTERTKRQRRIES